MPTPIRRSASCAIAEAENRILAATDATNKPCLMLCIDSPFFFSIRWSVEAKWSVLRQSSGMHGNSLLYWTMLHKEHKKFHVVEPGPKVVAHRRHS